MKVVRHDPVFAREVYEAYREISSNISYTTWLRDYVTPIAKMLEEEGVMKLVKPNERHPDSRQHNVVNFKAPLWMIREIEEIARELGVNRSELIRQALLFFITMYKMINKCR